MEKLIQLFDTNPMMFGLIIGGIIFIPLIIYKMATKSKGLKAIGNIKCQKCQHVGPGEEHFIPFKGQFIRCSKCGSEAWVKEQ